MSLVGHTLDASNGDPAKRGYVTWERALRGGPVPASAPPPPDHPAAGTLLVPPSAGDLGLVTARDLDEALRKGR